MLRSQILLLGSLLSAPFVAAVNPSCTPGIFSFIASEVSSIPAAQSYCSKNYPLSLRSTTSTAPTSTTTVSTNTVTTTVSTSTITSTVATQTNTATSTVTATTTVTVTMNANKKRQLSTTPAAPSTTRAISTTPAAPSTTRAISTTPAAPSTTPAAPSTTRAISTTPAAPSTTPAAPSTTRAISTTPAAPSTTPKTTPKISTTPSVPRKSTSSSMDKWQSVMSFESSIINDICTCVENPQTTTFTTTPISSVTATSTTSVTATSTADVTATVTTTTTTTTTTTATATVTPGPNACTPGAPGTEYPGQCGPAANSCACYIDTSGGGYCAGYYGDCGPQCTTDSDCSPGSGCLAASESDCGYNICANSSDQENCKTNGSSKRSFVMPRDGSSLRTYKRASQRHDTYTGDSGAGSRA